MDKQFTASEVHERERFEEWYTTHAYNYSRDPIGSRDCSLQWESWKAALAAHPAQAHPPAASVTDAMVERALSAYYVRDIDSAGFAWEDAVGDPRIAESDMRAALEAALIALDCEHDWQVEHKRAEKAEAELAAIKARISESVIATVSEYGVVSGVDSNPRSVRGKRVRLVVEK